MQVNRFICFLLVICFAISACLVSFAEEKKEIDLSTMTIDEITQLRTTIYDLSVEALMQLKLSVEDQLTKLGAADYVSLPSGNYLVGRDIAPGTYIISSHLLGNNGYVEITVYNVGETKESYDLAYRETSILAYEYDNALKEGKEMERPAVLDKGKYIAMDEVTLYKSGNTVRVTLVEGQTLTIEARYDMMVTIEKSTGLFMD